MVKRRGLRGKGKRGKEEFFHKTLFLGQKRNHRGEKSWCWGGGENCQKKKQLHGGNEAPREGKIEKIGLERKGIYMGSQKKKGSSKGSRIPRGEREEQKKLSMRKKKTMKKKESTSGTGKNRWGSLGGEKGVLLGRNFISNKNYGKGKLNYR